MADNSVGGLNIRIGADISEGERQIQKFVREFDTALKELSMGRRGGLYTTSAFRTAVEREQSRAQEEFARAGVVSGVNQVDPEAYRRLLMRNSGYAELAAQEEKQTQKFMQELALRSRMQRAADEGNVALEHAYRRQIEELRESSDERMLRMIHERADREVSIVESKLERQLQAEARAVAAFESMQASQLTRVRNLPIDIATGEVDQRRAEIYMLRKAGETAEADARQQQINEEKRAAEQQAEARRQIAQAEASKIQKINELLELSRQASLDANLALEKQYHQQILLLTETESEKRIRLAKESAEATVRINQEKLDAITSQELKAANQFASMQASQLTRLRNLPIDITTGEVDPRKAEVYMLRKAGETTEADARQRQINEEKRLGDEQAEVKRQIGLHQRAMTDAMNAGDIALRNIHFQALKDLRRGAAVDELQDIKDQAQRVLAQKQREAEQLFQTELSNWRRQQELRRAPFMEKVDTLQRSGQFLQADITENMGRRRQAIQAELNQLDELKTKLILVRDMMEDAREAGRTADVQQLDNMARRVENQIASLTNRTEDMRKGSNNAKYAVMNLAYGVQDAATVFGTSGFAGAIRASANNLTALGPLMSDIKSGATTLAQALLQPEVMMIGGATAALILVDAYTAYQKKQEELRNARIKEMAEFRMEEMRARPGQAEQAVAFETQLRRAQESGAEAAYEMARSQAEALEAKKAAAEVAEQQLAAESKILQELQKQKNVTEEQQADFFSNMKKDIAGLFNAEEAPMEPAQAQLEMENLRERLEAQQKRVKQLQEDTDKAHKERGRAEADALKAEENYNEARLKSDEKTRRDLDIERMMFERKEQLRFSDVAIAQTERILGERQARVAQLRQQAQAGPQFASMVAAGTQEDVAARLRMRAGTAAIDPLLEEAKKQVIEQREIRDELRAIREKMQPGYMVETFRP